MQTNDPIHLLMKEHETISSTVEIVRELEFVWQSNPDEYAKSVKSLITFFKDYSDKFHHHKEEDVLFPALKAHPLFSQKEILDELEEHHEMFRDSVKSIERNIEDKKWAESYESLLDYLDKLLDHIAIEDDELFVIADSLFSKDELERIYFQCQDIDQELGLDYKTSLVNQIKSKNYAS